MKCDFLGGRLPKCFFQEICSSGGKQTIHKVSAAFIAKKCHPRTSLSDYVAVDESRIPELNRLIVLFNNMMST